ncbi:MAG: TIM barrel protein, partial [Flavisolibacter sp.]|nr:TIM barrel protein [Flavisolibacter sp.]
MLNRRTFLQLSSAIAAGTLLTRCGERTTMNATTPPLNRIGLQLFSIPKLLEQDFAGTLKMIAQIGYKELEFYGPYPFSAAEDVERWKSVTPSLGFSGSGFFGHTVQQVKKILDDNGLSAPSIHTNLATLKQRMSEMAEAAHVLGTTYVVLPSAETQPNLDGYKRQAEEFNEIGAAAAKHNLRFAYHNHGNGLKAIEGKIPMEVILEQTDPKLVYFQMDIYWTTAGGIDPVAYLDKYAGRYRLMHIKDMSKPVRFSGDGGDPKQWIELFPYMSDAGSGVLNLKTILAHARTSGVEHFIMERDLAPNPKEALEKGYQ